VGNPATRDIEPLHVFVDTSVFVKQKFAFRNKYFTSLAQRVENGSITLLTTEVIIGELKSSIEKELDDNIAALKLAAKKTPLLRQIRSSQLSYTINYESREILLSELLSSIDTFIDDFEVVLVPLPMDTANTIFSRYFNRLPPFGTAKKKSEFPDSANIYALEVWAANNYQNIHVLALDTDLKAACNEQNRLIYVDDFARLLNQAIRIEWGDDPWTAEILLEFVKNNSSVFEDLMVYPLQSAISVNLGEGTVDSLSINYVDYQGLAIVDRRDCGDYIEFDANVTLNLDYIAFVSIGDDEFQNTIEYETTGKKELECVVSFELLPSEPAQFKITEVAFGDIDFEISIPLRY
jgi:PIN domain